VHRSLELSRSGAVRRRGGQGHCEPDWRKAKGDWDAWNARSLAEKPIVRVILDGTVVRVQLDREATAVGAHADDDQQRDR